MDLTHRRDDGPLALPPHFHPNHAPVERAWRVEDSHVETRRKTTPKRNFHNLSSIVTQSPSNQDRAKIPKHVVIKGQKIQNFNGLFDNLPALEAGGGAGCADLCHWTREKLARWPRRWPKFWPKKGPIWPIQTFAHGHPRPWTKTMVPTISLTK